MWEDEEPEGVSELTKLQTEKVLRALRAARITDLYFQGGHVKYAPGKENLKDKEFMAGVKNEPLENERLLPLNSTAARKMLLLHMQKLDMIAKVEYMIMRLLG